MNRSELPIDPDAESVARSRPVHLRPSAVGIVFAGGTVGTAAREALSLAVPAVDGVPCTILVVNVVGAFLLGVLLESLARRGPDRGRRQTIRLLLGTGVLGGFTTYSALAADTAALLGGGSAVTGVLYALATVILGGAATLAGIALASARRGKRAGG